MNGMLGLYGDLFGEINRMQKNLDQLRSPLGTTGIRAMPRRTFPMINVGSSPEMIEVLALAPGIDPNALQITVDKGVLVIAGERKTIFPLTRTTPASMRRSALTAVLGALFRCLAMSMQARSKPATAMACCACA
jgi:hypothetical protein